MENYFKPPRFSLEGTHKYHAMTEITKQFAIKI